ncbi:MAG: HYR domain-containing protein [Verrucomicrobia bacterium]|nr:HYR domain-containing protein [Verrucomicrobiota bacterium]
MKTSLLPSQHQPDRKIICSQFVALRMLCRWIPQGLGWLIGCWLFFHPAFAGAQTTILSEGFEFAFPGVWTVGNTGSGATWRDVNATFGGEGTHSGNWKGYCAGTAYPFNSNEPNPTYTNNMAAYMETNLNLRVCQNRAILRFWSKIPSIESGFDAAKVFLDGTVIWSNSSPQVAWTEVALDLSAFIGDFHKLRFEFDSDFSNTAEGWYLDDISVTAYDTMPPSVTCPANIVVDTDPGQCSKSNVTFLATVTDNCPGVTVACIPPSGSTFPAGLTAVTCTATDAAGNTDQCSFTVIVRDEPFIMCPSNNVALACSNSARVDFAVFTSNQCAYAGACVVPDNGNGTADLPPPDCQYGVPNDALRIINGLPVGTTIEMPPVLKDFTCGTSVVSVCSFPPTPGVCMVPGGTLGGEKGCSGATLALKLIGTGTLGGFNRAINLPVDFETHIAPRTLGAPVQSFNTDLFRFFGQLTGDPDFDLLRITAGTDFGMPSPGHTTLTSQPGNKWAVDSFFDITYRIDFVGHPGGAVGGMSGSTTGTIRIWTGSGPPPIVTCTPPSGSDFPLGTNVVTCVASNVWGRTSSCEFFVTVLPDTRPPDMPCPSNIVVQTCSNSFPVEFFPIATNHCPNGPACAVSDNGTGTAALPPAGCQYIAPDDVMQIIDGLAPGTTIRMTPILKNFLCTTSGVDICSFASPTPGVCHEPGGSLGGEKECSDATLALDLNGTGTLAGYHRALNIAVGFETHTAPRTLGAPVQSFDTDMFRFFGQITGDPDFDLLRITAGTDFGLPSPGHTMLTRQPDGTWAVDSFFDITYRVDFVGAAGGPLAGRSGSTTGTIRMLTGAGLYPPVACSPPSGSPFPLGVTLVTCTASNQWGYTNCSFKVTVNLTRPMLNVARQSTNIVIRWPDVCTAFRLQSAPYLTPPIPWIDVTNTPAHVGSESQVIVSAVNSNRFFRLYSP